MKEPLPPPTCSALQSKVGETQLQQLERDLPLADLLTCRAVARDCVAASAGSPASEGPASQRGLVAWGLAKATGMLGYVPRSEDLGSAGDLSAPTDADVRQLYEALDFRPEQQAPGAARVGGGGGGAGAGAAALQLTAGLLLSHAVVGLEAALPAGGTATLAVIDLDRLKLSAEAGPGAVTVGLDLVDASVLDLTSPGVSELMLGEPFGGGELHAQRRALPCTRPWAPD